MLRAGYTSAWPHSDSSWNRWLALPRVPRVPPRVPRAMRVMCAMLTTAAPLTSYLHSNSYTLPLTSYLLSLPDRSPSPLSLTPTSALPNAGDET
eukprot:6243698-Prymnesium_polylepis.1